MEYKLSFSVNRQPVEIVVEPHLTLLEVLRDTLGLTGTKEGCGTGDCVQQDGMSALLEQMVHSRVWVLGTPVYWWGPTAQFKAFGGTGLSEGCSWAGALSSSCLWEVARAMRGTRWGCSRTS